MSSAAGPDPTEAPEERRFLRALELQPQLPDMGRAELSSNATTSLVQRRKQAWGRQSWLEQIWNTLAVCQSTAEAAALERELLEDYRFGRQQLVELCGHASAVAVTKAFPLPALSRKQRTVLVVCGPEQNGAVGLVCARHLRVFEYEPTIFYPMRSLDLLHRDLTTQCEKMDIPFLSYLPTEVQLINEAYGLVVDAVLGPGVEPGEVGGPCTRALATLKLLSIPLVSLDIPSGWDAETGSDADGLRPDVLVSLAAPKRCAGRFSGRHHFVAGRFVPDDVRRKFALRLPGYTGTDCVAAL
uniref:YjeF N-terminal domain-containing protein 3 n=1 Tax=Piliocolobus tephrosceles TaxID=591936 RepID=A0A8C9HY54_9PRIM